MGSRLAVAGFDYLAVNSRAYRVERYPRGPDNVQLIAGDELVWYADSSITGMGFEGEGILIASDCF